MAATCGVPVKLWSFWAPAKTTKNVAGVGVRSSRTLSGIRSHAPLELFLWKRWLKSRFFENPVNRNWYQNRPMEARSALGPSKNAPWGWFWKNLKKQCKIDRKMKGFWSDKHGKPLFLHEKYIVFWNLVVSKKKNLNFIHEILTPRRLCRRRASPLHP